MNVVVAVVDFAIQKLNDSKNRNVLLSIATWDL